MNYPAEYRGRFAPSPTGPLHFGSLLAALGSYLDAKHNQGSWLLRMEDLDTPRVLPGAADGILRTLESHGLHWDEDIMWQSHRTEAYQEAFKRLQAIGAVYPCSCTRKEIADSGLHGIDGQIYPGTCRKGPVAERGTYAWRVRSDHAWQAEKRTDVIALNDVLQGHISHHLEKEIGDFVVKRADGLYTYQLAVVVDDACQHISHIVRGADLLNSTTRQIHLQHLLQLPTPNYQHLPVLINAQGEKLSKQTLAQAVDDNQPVVQLLRGLHLLQQEPPPELINYDVGTVLEWAIKNWNKDALTEILKIRSE